MLQKNSLRTPKKFLDLHAFQYEYRTSHLDSTGDEPLRVEIELLHESAGYHIPKPFSYCRAQLDGNPPRPSVHLPHDLGKPTRPMIPAALATLAASASSESQPAYLAARRTIAACYECSGLPPPRKARCTRKGQIGTKPCQPPVRCRLSYSTKFSALGSMGVFC